MEQQKLNEALYSVKKMSDFFTSTAEGFKKIHEEVASVVVTLELVTEELEVKKARIGGEIDVLEKRKAELTPQVEDFEEKAAKLAGVKAEIESLKKKMIG